MKIYTKINYQWLDDKLVKTSSNSFEYTGELSLCNGLGQAISSATSLGGEGGGVLDNALETATGLATDPLGTTTTIIDENTDSILDSEDVQDAADKAEGAVTDPLGTTTTIIDENTDSVADSEDVQDAADKAEDLADPNTYTEAIAEGISTGTAAIHAGLDDTVGSINTDQLAIGGTTKDLLDKFQYNVGGVLDGWTTSINDGLDMLHGNTGGGGNVEVKKMKNAGKRGLKNKTNANLKVNKSKGQARKSLKINRPK